MNTSRPFWLAMLERVVAFVFLTALFPTLLFIGLLIGVTAGSPVVVTDSVATTDGALAQSHRFRTTGPGTPVFTPSAGCSDDTGSMSSRHCGAFLVATSV